MARVAPGGATLTRAPVLAGALLLAACSREASNPAPPRLETPARLPVQSSTVAFPVSVPLPLVRQELEAAIPTTLYAIDRREPRCVPAQRIKLCLVPRYETQNGRRVRTGCRIGGDRLKVTPDLSCRIVGQVTRGPLALSGRGEAIRLSMPVSARVRAEDVGGVLNETATARAEVRGAIRLGLRPDWTPTATLSIDYDWTQPPGIQIVGQRITFAGKADTELGKVIARLERDLPARLARFDLKRRAEGIWRDAHTVVELNRVAPPAWLRITPEAVGFAGYSVDARAVTLTVQARARTETFVGPRPPDPVPAPLPGLAPLQARGLRVFVPVLADYAELQPVIDRALARAARDGVEVPRLGRVDVAFGPSAVYPTTGERLAVGVPLRVTDRRTGFAARGTVWLTARVRNQPGSQRLQATNLRIDGRTDSRAFDLLFRVVNAPEVLPQIEAGLAHDFAPDYDRVIAAARRATQDKRIGDVVLSVRFDTVENGAILATSQGLFMPVTAAGSGRLRYSPRPSKAAVAQTG